MGTLGHPNANEHEQAFGIGTPDVQGVSIFLQE